MIKKVVLSYLLFFTVSFAIASPPVDPDKREQEQQREGRALVVTETPEEYHSLEGKDQLLEVVEQPIPKKEDTPQTGKTADDVQSFNFLYYIIHHFKFSDFIPQ